MEATRVASSISDAMYVALTNEIATLQYRVASPEARAAAQFPAGIMNFSMLQDLQASHKVTFFGY